MTVERNYRLQLLAMLSTDGRRPRLDRPIPAAVGVSLHRCGDPLAVHADSDAAAVRMLEDAIAAADVAPAWVASYRGPRHHGRWPKPGDVVTVDGQPQWQRADDGYHRIPPDHQPRVRALVDPRSWRDTLFPLEHALERGRRLPGLVDIRLDRRDLRALRQALTDPASRPRHDTTLQLVESQAIAQQRRPGGLADGITLRMVGFGVRDASHALLAAATTWEHHPRTPSPERADALRARCATSKARQPPKPWTRRRCADPPSWTCRGDRHRLGGRPQPAGATGGHGGGGTSHCREGPRWPVSSCGCSTPWEPPMTPNRDNPHRPTVMLDEQQVGALGYQAWLHHAMWCPTRLAAIPDPLTYFQDLDERMEARLKAELNQTPGLPAGSNARWRARLDAEPRIVREMGMPPAEVDQPVWTPDDETEPGAQPLGDMDQAMDLLDEAIAAVRDDRDPTPALDRLDQLRRPDGGRD